MIPTLVLALVLGAIVVACLILAWYTRRWPDPRSGGSPFGQLNRNELAKVLGRQVEEIDQ